MLGFGLYILSLSKCGEMLIALYVFEEFIPINCATEKRKLFILALHGLYMCSFDFIAMELMTMACG